MINMLLFLTGFCTGIVTTFVVAIIANKAEDDN